MKTNRSLLNVLPFTPAIMAALVLGGSATSALAQDNSRSVEPSPDLNLPLVVPTTQNTSPSVSDPTYDPASMIQIQQYGKEGKTKGQAQVTSVSQLSDVQPTDWAFQALQSLVERYGCIAGYPNRTYRGNRAITRYEFAAGLNACMDRVNELIASATADLVKKEDLELIKKLQEQFAAELATLRGRVDSLEARTKTLEAQQFSTTTKLAGEVIFQGTQTSGGNKPVPTGFPQGLLGKINDNFTFNSRATLNLLTSFSGKDLLITSLQQGNFPTVAGSAFGLTNAVLSTQVAQASTSQVALYYLGYRFPVLKDKGTIYITATGGELSDFVDTLNPKLDSAGEGSLSAFGLRNPIYRQLSSFNGGSNFSGTGAGFNFNFNKKVSFGAGYLVPTVFAASPNSTQVVGSQVIFGGGLFSSDYAAIAQVTIKPTDNFGFGLTYIRSFTQRAPNIGLGGYTGTLGANVPFGNVATSANTGGFQFNWNATRRFGLSGWTGVSFANLETAVDADATILNFGLAATFPDLFKKGSLGALIIGAEPSIISSSIPGNADSDLPIHLEALYRYRVNDFISITPGIIGILNPEGNSDNDPIILGTIRTTFNF
jgi:hypothetical protein